MRDYPDYGVSSFCTDGECVGVAIDSDAVVVANLADGADTPPLRFGREEWAAFVAGVKAGEFDLP